MLWNNELIKFCEHVQDCFKNNDIEHIFEQEEDIAVLDCFALIYIMNILQTVVPFIKIHIILGIFLKIFPL